MTRLQKLRTTLNLPDAMFADIKKYLKKKKDGGPPESDISWLISETKNKSSLKR